MKKGIALLLCLGLLLSLCACGNQEKETTPPETEPAVEVTAPELPAEEETTPETQAPAEETEPEQDMVEVVRGYIDRPVEELYEVIGEPQSSDYASSCLGDGEDGLLIYDGFVVYTYREGDSETVYDVE